MASRSTRFDALRLSREADMAGQSFAFEDASPPVGDGSRLSNWLWWAAAAAAFVGLIGLGIG